MAILSACESLPKHPDHLPKVTALIETEPVVAIAGEDAADDPALWVHPTDSSQSKIIGTNKLLGLDVYDLRGTRLYSYPIGRVNNVDIRYGFPLTDSMKVDIVAASERNLNQIVVMRIHSEDGSLTPLTAGISSRLPEVYGFCLYHSPANHQFYAFINDKSGKVEQWHLTATAGNSVEGQLVRTLQVASQPEGMVADDVEGKLYVGEEGKGIWVFSAEADGSVSPEFISMSGKKNTDISFDIEGLAIYRSPLENYLLASSQGNHSYAVFKLEEGYPYVGSFCVGNNGSIDGTEETDGIEVSSVNLGGAFTRGVFIAQDGYNYSPEGEAVAQNFKLVPWKEIVEILSKH